MNENILAKGEKVLCEHAIALEENGYLVWYDRHKNKLLCEDATIIFDYEGDSVSWIDNEKTQITFVKPRVKRIETLKTKEDYENAIKDWGNMLSYRAVAWLDYLYEEVEVEE